MPYALAPGVSYCESGDRLIFLDLRTDRYSCLSSSVEAMFRSAVLGTPAGSTELDRLVARGLLTHAPIAALNATPAPARPCRSALDATPGAMPSPLLTAQAYMAVMAARWSLRRSRTAGALARLKDLPVPGEAEAAQSKLAGLALAFRATALLASPLDQCLPRSIALAMLARRRGVGVSLVIGVRLRPFLAHAWAQADDLLLNDRPDTVRTFTPILVT